MALTWDAVSGATSYSVKRATVSGGLYATVQSGLTATSHTDTGLTSGVTYYYVVSAANAGGEGPNSNEASATPFVRTFVFSDGFETGNLSKWTSSGGLTVQTRRTHSGTYAAQGNTMNAATYAKKTLATTYTSGYFRIWFYLASGYSSQVNLMRYRTAADGSIAYLFVDTAGKLTLRNDAGAVTITSTTSVASDTWHALEFHLVVNGTSSSTEVRLDDVRVNNLSHAHRASPLARTSSDQRADLNVNRACGAAPF